jgi:2-oxoglutarate ferredoxin oxidoreductase subunit alpha
MGCAGSMNAAALKTNIKHLKKGGKIIVNVDGFDAKNLRLANYPEGVNPIEDKTLEGFEVIKRHRKCFKIQVMRF